MGFFIKRKTLDVLPVLDVENEYTIENELCETFFSLRAAYRAAANVVGLIPYIFDRVVPRLLPALAVAQATNNPAGLIGVIMGDPVIGPVLHRVVTNVKENL